ncbi:MAG TPA: tetratricopeptide repeat protein [Pseudobdellovibrionaceae bacterium]|nr:tetratricopeptide repeat protein [Pseudobdellovibrionaceae bacterium]
MTWIVLFIFPLAAQAKNSKSKTANEFSEQALLIELTGKDQGKLSEVDLYSELVSAYQSQDEIGFQSRLQTFLSRFPKSSFADNALYLAGRKSLEQKRYAPALQYFHRIVSEYPRGNRAVSAQFAKAMTYKQMNLTAESRKVMKEVMRKYPGSPESFRAEGEMRLLN